MTTRSPQEHAQEAILSKIKEVADQLDADRPEHTSNVLKSLAEAYAWAVAPQHAH
ncbi:hypothetical protein ABZS61_34035 [Streptomyces sp. NPDC005566]|uniref:hypothetical protein n=1 Tax=Streptomyces sp. NPDC005566 TaxID=3156886 RepID=UPI0033B6EC3F